MIFAFREFQTEENGCSELQHVDVEREHSELRDTRWYEGCTKPGAGGMVY